jgi:hypothetical protein
MTRPPGDKPAIAHAGQPIITQYRQCRGRRWLLRVASAGGVAPRTLFVATDQYRTMLRSPLPGRNRTGSNRLRGRPSVWRAQHGLGAIHDQKVWLQIPTLVARSCALTRSWDAPRDFIEAAIRPFMSLTCTRHMGARAAARALSLCLPACRPMTGSAPPHGGTK